MYDPNPQAQSAAAQPAAETVDTAAEPAKTIAAKLDRGDANVHNFDGDSREKYRRIAIACGSNTVKSDDSIGKEIDLKYYFAHRVEMIDQKTGEAFDQTRIVLFDKNDVAYSFVSGGIVDSINLLISAFGQGPWIEPMAHKVIESRTNSGRKMLSLAFV